jgi:DNA-binding MarR family transcriptional regulator
MGDLSKQSGKQKQNGLFGNSPQDISDWFLKHASDVDPLSVQSHVLLNRVYMQISAKNEVGKEKPYTTGWFNVLSQLDRAGDRGLLMTEVAAGINISITNLPKLMDNLEAHQLITRTRDSEDGRKRWAHLTPLGKEWLEAEVPRAGRSITQAWESLPNRDKRRLINLFAKLVEGFPDHTNRHWT